MRRTLTLAEGVRAQSLRRLVRQKVTCAFCGHRYLPRQLRLVGFDGTLWLFLGACSHCRSVALIAVIPGSGAGRRAAYGPAASATDNSSGQADTAAVASVTPATAVTADAAVTIDDVLDLHEHLASFDGDFHRLFQSGQPGVDG